MKRFTKALKATTIAFAAVGLMVTSAMATDGMFGNGTGARNKALAGAGVADQNDATAMSINPAGLVHSDTQFSTSASLFSPWRSYEVSGGLPAGGEVESDSNYFVIPNIAYAYRVDANTVFGLSMYGNGGMNTNYKYSGANGFPGPNPAPNGNPFGTGTTTYGIDLTQIFMSAGIGKQYGNLAVGIAPIVAIQIFDTDGLSAFGASDHTETTVGIAVRGGVEWAVAPNFRVAAAGATPTYMQDFNGYTGFFAAGKGNLQLPATVQAGIALDVSPTLTVMADYKRIFYGQTDEMGTSSNAAAFGFGWHDINIYKLGVEWDVNPGFTLRAGYSYNDNPIKSTDVTLNALAPGVVMHHITGGAKMKISDTIDLELAGMYAPKNDVSGPRIVQGNVIGDNINISMYQFELTAGIVWHLGETEAPLK